MYYSPLNRWISAETVIYCELAKEILANRLRNQANPFDVPSVLFAISDSWVQYFIHPYLDLETTYTRIIEAARVKEVTTEALDRRFVELRMMIAEKNIRTENMYNMDGAGFAVGSVKGSYVVVNKFSNTRYQAHPILL